MAFAVTGTNEVTQTGTDSDLSGLNGVGSFASITPQDYAYDLVLIDAAGKECTAWLDDYTVDFRIDQD